MAVIMEGKKVANLVSEQLKTYIDNDLTQGYRNPHLVVFLIGDDIASKIYVNHKIKACEQLKIKVTLKTLPESIHEQQLLAMIDEVNKDITVDAILIQLPLPKHLNKNNILMAINYQKDVDGLHFINAGKLFQGVEGIVPCTPLAVLKMLDVYNIDVNQKTITVIGTSNLVGKPLAILLHERGATVTLCNKNTIDFKKYTLISDIVICATGVGNILDETMIRRNAVVIDVAINRDLQTNKLYGDVKFEQVKDKTSYITPVPNGVGPVTIAMLMANVYRLYKENVKKHNKLNKE